ncbi:MAG: ATP-binding protein [Prevotellaceae bacterium]|jgi:predicted AAA+ superfamily ATPase|nr:ATP-binding protein [Prevotellaceae bacterium]
MTEGMINIKNLIPRRLYTNKITPFIDKKMIKVITGQRRVGKSYILFQLIEEIKQQNPKANVIYINKELKTFETITDDNTLYHYVKKQLQVDTQNYLFVDEIQDIQHFEKALRSLLVEDCCDIFCTGSNAKLLSGELATFLGGRYMEFVVHSLSYSEFLHFFSLENTNDNLYKYIQVGGMPYIKVIGLNELQIFEYLKNLYASILLKDVVARENIRNIHFLENLVEFLADNIGNLFSASNISKYLKSQQTSVTPQLVLNYLKSLLNAFFLHKTTRYDIKGMRIFEFGEKYYFEDIGLRNCIRGFNRQNDIGKVIENLVYLHLLQSGCKVFVGKLDNEEIDFIAEKDGQKIYVQVAYLLVDKKTQEREFGNLLKIDDNYRKYVVTMDDYNIHSNYNGVEHMHLRNFLMLSI